MAPLAAVPASDNEKAEGEVDLDFNPVLQARMLIEKGEKSRRGGKQLRAGAAGALGRLVKYIGGNLQGEQGKGMKGKKRDRIRELDRDLAKEAKAALALERAKEQDEALFRKAERAALEAKKEQTRGRH